MNIELFQVLPDVIVEPSMMFTYPSCLADVYTPGIERIWLPEVRYTGLTARVKVAPGVVSWQPRLFKQKVYRTLYKLAKGSSTHNLADRFIFDTRADTDKNIAHVIESACSRVLYAQRLLSEHLNRPIEILTIVRERVSNLAKEIYAALDLPIFCTDNPVYGQVVDVSEYSDLFGIQPEIFNLPIKNYNPNTPERVFIARRGNRCLSNEAEIRQFLEQKGFTTYYFEDLLVSEKWSVARNAKVAVAVHGAGTGNFIFNRQGLDSAEPKSGLRLIELFSPNFVIPTYRHFSTTLNGRWCGVRGQITPETMRFLDFNSHRDTLKSPIKDPCKIDLGSLQMALEYLEID